VLRHGSICVNVVNNYATIIYEIDSLFDVYHHKHSIVQSFFLLLCIIRSNQRFVVRQKVVMVVLAFYVRTYLVDELNTMVCAIVEY
jgi:hypothetical protein